MSFDEKKCLAYDPFADDFGEPGDRWLHNKIVSAKKPGRCPCCRGAIKVGTRIRRIVKLYVREGILSWRVCSDCCAAMALSWQDAGAAIEARYSLNRPHRKRVTGGPHQRPQRKRA